MLAFIFCSFSLCLGFESMDFGYCNIGDYDCQFYFIVLSAKRIAVLQEILLAGQLKLIKRSLQLFYRF